MPEPLIETLIDKVDNVELVRDQIAAILLLETAGQQALAEAAGKNPYQWKLRIFTERAAPWEEFPLEGWEGAGPEKLVPIVNVQVASGSYDESSSDVFEQQKADGIFFIDCYGFGVTRAAADRPQELGDKWAALEAMRAFRLVRNILMAGHYTTLGMTDTVWRRFPASYELQEVQDEGRAHPHVRILRFTFKVEFSELSPQYQGQPLELISAEVLRAPNGQVLLRASFPFPS